MTKSALLLSFGLLWAAGYAMADPIGGPSNTNCTNNSCQGATYWLEYSGSPISSTATTQTFRITYKIDTSTLNLPGAVAIDAVSVKVSSSATATLFSAPGGVGNWNIVPGGLNAGGCSGAGSGDNCADWIAAGVGTPVGGTLTWVFDVTIPTGTLMTTAFGPSIKARYVDANGDKIGALVSENITLQRTQEVPEPSSVLLLSSIAGVLIFVGKKKLFA